MPFLLQQEHMLAVLPYVMCARSNLKTLAQAPWLLHRLPLCFTGEKYPPLRISFNSASYFSLHSTPNPTTAAGQ